MTDGKNLLVAVACAWYNRADSICDTVNSLLAQDFNNFEVVVVNDGSTDPRVKEILDSYDDSRLRVIHQENRGFVKAIIHAIEASDAPYIAIQGAGDISHPQRLLRQWQLIATDNNIGAVSSHYENRFVADRSQCLSYFKPQPIPPWEQGQTIPKNFSFSHGEMMYRREAYNQVGGYRSFFKYGQGSDLWRRMLVQGWRFEVVNEVLYWRILYDDGVAVNPRQRALRLVFAALSIESIEREVAGKSAPTHPIEWMMIQSPRIDEAWAKAAVVLSANKLVAERNEFLKLARYFRIKTFFLGLIARSHLLSHLLINRFSGLQEIKTGKTLN